MSSTVEAIDIALKGANALQATVVRLKRDFRDLTGENTRLREALEAVRRLITHPDDIAWLEMNSERTGAVSAPIDGPLWKTINEALK